MLRGSIAAKIDDKGRLKVPNAFRSAITEKYGDIVYVTSVTGQSVLIYPMSVWVDIEEKLKGVPSALPARRRYFDRVNYYGQQTEFDRQGRVSIHARLRESAEMVGDVDVFGNLSYLEVWNHERFAKKLAQEPLTDEDFSALADYGI
ncbi:MAG: division/cell wall cluster transcriptional repressor MraZ [Acidobacteria bacterium]|nr:division/cell wall cluster transcriptional repressor MraZ [Acidobacteriota bacterium]